VHFAAFVVDLAYRRAGLQSSGLTFGLWAFLVTCQSVTLASVARFTDTLNQVRKSP
jgi:hypothetical protein